MRFASLAALTFALSLPAVAASSRDKAIWLPKHDAKMEAAIGEAKRTLPRFWPMADSSDRDITDRVVKVGYRTAHGGVEYLWIYVESHSDRAVHGKIANEPEDVPTIRKGQLVTADISEVVDWGYCRGARCFGQFTTRVVLESADDATRRAIGAELSPTPLEPEFN